MGIVVCENAQVLQMSGRSGSCEWMSGKFRQRKSGVGNFVGGNGAKQRVQTK